MAEELIPIWGNYESQLQTVEVVERVRIKVARYIANITTNN